MMLLLGLLAASHHDVDDSTNPNSCWVVSLPWMLRLLLVEIVVVVVVVVGGD